MYNGHMPDGEKTPAPGAQQDGARNGRSWTNMKAAAALDDAFERAFPPKKKEEPPVEIIAPQNPLQREREPEPEPEIFRPKPKRRPDISVRTFKRLLIAAAVVFAALVLVIIAAGTGDDFSDYSDETLYELWAAHYELGDYETGFEYLEEAAERGWAPAQRDLGLCYEYGYCVRQNFKKAAELYEKAAEQGLASAQYNLALMYLSGLGVDKDKVEGLRLLKLSASQGFADAVEALGEAEQGA